MGTNTYVYNQAPATKIYCTTHASVTNHLCVPHLLALAWGAAELTHALVWVNRYCGGGR